MILWSCIFLCVLISIPGPGNDDFGLFIHLFPRKIARNYDSITFVYSAIDLKNPIS